MSNEKNTQAENITIESIMTKNVISVNPNATVGQVINLFIKTNISCAPLVNRSNVVVSLVNETDLMKFAIIGGTKVPLQNYLNKLVAMDRVLTVNIRDTFADVFTQFIKEPVRRVIVVDATGKLQGIVSRKNILKVFAKSETKVS